MEDHIHMYCKGKIEVYYQAIMGCGLPRKYLYHHGHGGIFCMMGCEANSKGAANVILSILLTNFYNQAATVGCVVVFIFHPDHGYFKQRDRASKVEDHYVNLVSHPIMTFCQLFYFQKSHLNILQ